MALLNSASRFSAPVAAQLLVLDPIVAAIRSSASSRSLRGSFGEILLRSTPEGSCIGDKVSAVYFWFI